jgi:hypothetical protein
MEELMIALSLRYRLGRLVLALLVFAAPVAAEEVTVYAAASLTDALKDVAQGLEAQTGHKVVFNLGASNDLARQIKAGARADVFFSADKAQMDGLEAAGLVRAADRVDVLSNVLVVVVPASSSARMIQPTDLLAVKHPGRAEPGSDWCRPEDGHGDGRSQDREHLPALHDHRRGDAARCLRPTRRAPRSGAREEQPKYSQSQ